MMVSVHPPYGGGSAHSSKELADGLRSIGHHVVHVAPYNHDREDELHQAPGLIWIKADFAWNNLDIDPNAQASMNKDLQEIYAKQGPFDYVILGRETFVWHIEAIKEVHAGPVMLIVRGAYINRLSANTNELIEPRLKQQLIDLYKKADVIVCIARHLVGAINRVIFDNNLEEARTVFIPNPIKLPAFQERPIEGPNGAPRKLRIVMAAQLKSRKRPLDAIDIVKHLVDMGVDVELTSFGDGPDMPKMKSLIEKHGLQNQLILRGHVSRAEVLKGFNQSDIVLLCSDNEGWPRVLQEAIAAGKAIIAYDNIGSREVIEQWVTPWQLGRLVPIGDTRAAAEAAFELNELFRTNTKPFRRPDLPDSLEVLHEYEQTLRSLSSEAAL